MSIDDNFRGITIYGVLLTAQSSLHELRASLSILGTLLVRVDNAPWMTLSFVANPTQPDAELSCNLIFRNEKLCMMSICLDELHNKVVTSDFRRILATVGDQRNDVGWAEIQYLHDFKAGFDYLSVSFIE